MELIDKEENLNKRIRDRIENIKKILSFCSNDEIILYNKECAEYFTEFFNDRPNKKGNSLFHKPFSGMVTIGNYLACTADNPTLFLSYEYESESAWHEYDNEFILFNDDKAKYKDGYGTWGYRYDEDSMYRGELEYYEISEDVWKIIEDGLRPK